MKFLFKKITVVHSKFKFFLCTLFQFLTEIIIFLHNFFFCLAISQLLYAVHLFSRAFRNIISICIDLALLLYFLIIIFAMNMRISLKTSINCFYRSRLFNCKVILCSCVNNFFSPKFLLMDQFFFCV